MTCCWNIEVDNLLQRMTIVGVILCFRQLGQEALNDVLNQRVPFLLSSIIDFKEHFPAEELDATVNLHNYSMAKLFIIHFYFIRW